MILSSLATAVLLAFGVAVAAGGIAALLRRRQDRRHGALVQVDLGSDRGAPMRSERYRLFGRPDIVRRNAVGIEIPIEIKSRPRPPSGPARSHIVQVWAYCLLLEERTGRAPPYGVLRYGGGAEVEVPWGSVERGILRELRREMDRPYDGRARPSPARCARCRWAPVCDARARSGDR